MSDLTPDVQLREYQKDVLEFAKNHNTICVLPTGVGKTLVAFELAAYVKKCDAADGKPLRMSFFLSPTCNLTAQQSAASQKRLDTMEIVSFVVVLHSCECVFHFFCLFCVFWL